MDLKDLAEALVAGCRDGTDTANLDTLYSPKAVSVEAVDHGQGRESVGLDAIRGKHAWWASSFEMLSGEIKGPFLHGDDRFAVYFEVETKEIATGEVSTMTEVGVYHVAGGRIVREEFFYAM